MIAQSCQKPLAPQQSTQANHGPPSSNTHVSGLEYLTLLAEDHPIWRALGVLGRLAVLLTVSIIGIGIVLTSGHVLLSIALKLCVLPILISFMWGLWQMFRDPLRAARYRQIQRHVRSKPGKERRPTRKRLLLNFDTLVAEGFD